MGGQAKTPNIDALAARGMLFTNAHCVFPACNPSRTAIMTGQRPETTGQYTNKGNFRDKPGGMERITLPQYLQSNGYETVAAGKVFHQPPGKGKELNVLSDPASWSTQFPNNAGTSGGKEYLDENGQAKWLEGALAKELKVKDGGGYLSRSGVWGITDQTKEETADWQNAHFAREYLEQAHDRPFFLACGIFRPHAPLIAPKVYFDMYPIDQVKVHDMPEDDLDDIPEGYKTNFSSEFVNLVKEKNQIKNAIQAYLAAMSFADDCVGEILAGIENGPNKESTVVVLWTDHGWQLGHKDRWEKYSLWHQGTNTPLIISYPGMTASETQSKQAVSLLDLYPTVLDILELRKPAFIEGETLFPFLSGNNFKREQPAIITYPDSKSHGVRFENWNYILYDNGSEELYDHDIDPQEFTNLAMDPNYKSVILNLKQHLKDY